MEFDCLLDLFKWVYEITRTGTLPKDIRDSSRENLQGFRPGQTQTRLRSHRGLKFQI